MLSLARGPRVSLHFPVKEDVGAISGPGCAETPPGPKASVWIPVENHCGSDVAGSVAGLRATPEQVLEHCHLGKN